MPLITEKEMYGYLRDLTMPQRYAMFRYLAHIADHAATDDYYRHVLEILDFDRFKPDMLAFMRAIRDSYPHLSDSLSPTQAARLLDARPVSPALKLVERPCGVRDFAKWGLLL